MLVVYAPAGIDRFEVERVTAFTEPATRAGFVVAYADHRPLGPQSTKDLGSIPAIVAARWCIDAQRVFYSGHSDGGSVANALAAMPETRNRALGIAPSAAGTPMRISLRTAAHVHMTAVAAWWGGLLPLAYSARTVTPLMEFAVLFRRFSKLATVAMALMLGTGIYLAWAHVAAWPSLFGTRYGQLLLLKLWLIALVLAMAARLRWRWLRDLEILPAALVARRLPRWIRVEWTMAFAVLAIAALMSGTPPARHEQVLWPFAFRFAPQITWVRPGVPALVLTGCALVAVAAVLVGSIRHRRGRALSVAAAVLLLALGMPLALAPLSVPAFRDTYRTSAVAYHAISIDHGADLFKQHCVACHGEGGLGNGPLARTLAKAPADLSAPHSADHTAGDMYWWLSYGIPAGKMPGFAHVLDEEARWDLINFLRTFSNGYQARIIRPHIAKWQPWLAAPDFNYVTQAGAGGSLRELRANRAALLVFFSWPDSRMRLEQLQASKAGLDAAGASVIALPLNQIPASVIAELGLPVVVQGAEEAARTYLLLRRTLNTPDTGDRSALPAHMEVLVDRFGYVRARWLPRESGDWKNLKDVLTQLEALGAEPEILPPPDEHIH